MIKKISLMILVITLLLLTACSSSEPSNKAGIEITGIISSIGAVGENVDDFERQSFKYTITLTNNEAADITIISVSPILSEKFLELVENKDTTIQVNDTIPKGSSINVPGEIIFKSKDLNKEEIISLEPFVERVKVIEERNIQKSF